MKHFDSEQENGLEDIAQFYDETDTADLVGDEVELETPRRPMVSRSIRVDRATMDELKEIADARGVGVTQLMRSWILERLALEQSSTQDVRQARLIHAALSSLLGERNVEDRSIADHAASRPSISSAAAVQRLVLSGVNEPSASAISTATAVKVLGERVPADHHREGRLNILARRYVNARRSREL